MEMSVYNGRVEQSTSIADLGRHQVNAENSVMETRRSGRLGIQSRRICGARTVPGGSPAIWRIVHDSP